MCSPAVVKLQTLPGQAGELHAHIELSVQASLSLGRGSVQLESGSRPSPGPTHSTTRVRVPVPQVVEQGPKGPTRHVPAMDTPASASPLSGVVASGEAASGPGPGVASGAPPSAPGARGPRPVTGTDRTGALSAVLSMTRRALSSTPAGAPR